MADAGFSVGMGDPGLGLAPSFNWTSVTGVVSSSGTPSFESLQYDRSTPRSNYGSFPDPELDRKGWTTDYRNSPMSSGFSSPYNPIGMPGMQGDLYGKNPGYR